MFPAAFSMANLASAAPIVANAQEALHEFWSLTGVMKFWPRTLRQSI